MIDEELTGLLQTEIAIICNDGQAYRGILKSFDRDIMVLEEIYETSNEEIDWIEIKDEKTKGTSIKGYIPWRRVTLPKLIIRMQMILRIWPWAPKEVGETTAPAKKKTGKKGTKKGAKSKK